MTLHQGLTFAFSFVQPVSHFTAPHACLPSLPLAVSVVQ